ncbi:MAG: hypothetical protein PUB20_02680 [Clostridia bacterium]|nr:hypothetical protein [Clostridia bacterium]
MQKSLEELSEEYFKAAEGISEIIAKYRKQLQEAYRSKNYLKTYDIKRKLAVLYDQKQETVATAYELKNYYNKSQEEKIA